MKNNKNMKKLLSLVLTLCMVLSLIPAMSLTASATEYKSGSYPISQLRAGDIIYPGVTLTAVAATSGGTPFYWIYVYENESATQQVADVHANGAGQSLTVSKTLTDGQNSLTTTDAWKCRAVPSFLSSFFSYGGPYIWVVPYTIPNYSVTVTPAATSHMTKTEDSGAASQPVITPGNAMASVVYTADTGYGFPSTYSVATKNGVSVTRNDSTQITVSGTPTGNVSLTLPAATPITRTVSVGLDSTSMETVSGSGDSTQNAVAYNTAMTDVVVQTKAGYHFPDDYAVNTINGISVTRDSDTQVTVFGTPTCDPFGTVTVNLPAATPNEYTMTLAKNSKVQSVAVTKGGTAGTVDADGAGTYTVTYNTEITVTATPIDDVDGNEYSFYRWVSGTTTKSNAAEYTFTWDTADNMTLTAQGVGGLVAVGRISVAPAALEADKTATVTLDGTPGVAHSVSLVNGSTTIALTKGEDHSYTASLPASDTTVYEVWVDGIKTTQTVKGGSSASVTMEAFDCTMQKDGAAWTEGNDHIVALRYNGIVYPSGSVLPTGVSYERLVDGAVYGDALTENAATDFYTVTFMDGETTFGGDTPFKPQAVLKGQTAAVPTAKPVKADNTFLGWSTTGSEPLFDFAAETIIAATGLKAVWQDNTACETRWIVDGETFYGTLAEALAGAQSGDRIYVQHDCAINGGTLASGVTLEMDTAGLTITNSGTFTNEGAIINNGSITGSMTNNGTVTNTVVSGEDNSGKLGAVTNSDTVTGGTLGSLSNSGTVKNASVTGGTTNSGTLDGCRIGSGTAIGGTITGSTYAGNGVTFGSGAIFSAATVSIQGGGTVNAACDNANAATSFAGVVEIREVSGKRYIKPMANLILRAPISFAQGANLELDSRNIVGTSGNDGAPGGNGVTPIKVADGVLSITGTGSIIGGNGGDATSFGNGGNGGSGVDTFNGGSGGASVEIGESIAVRGGNGGTGNGTGNTGGAAGDGVKGSGDTNDYVRVAGTAEGGNGGPAINGATAGAGGNGVNAAIVYDGGGTLTGGQPGNGRFGDPLNPDTSSGVTSETAGEGKTAEFTWIVDFTISRMSATNSTHPSNQITPNHEGHYTSTLAITPAGNQYISAPETITVKMGTKALTAGEGKDYTYDKTTGVFELLIESEAITGNISITANGVVPSKVDVDTPAKLQDALEAGLKDIHITENVTLSASNTVLENSVVYVDAEKTLTVAGGQTLTVAGAVVVKGTLTGTATPTGTGSVLETPVGGWSDLDNSDFITGLKANTTYKAGGVAAATTADGKLFIRNEWIGKTIKLVQYDSVRGLSSPEQELDLTAMPEKPAAPVSSRFKVTQPGSAEATGLIECLPETDAATSVTYQYSTDNGKTWNNLTSGNTIPTIPQGTDVFVRFPAFADPATPASQILTIRINTYTPPTSGGGGSGSMATEVPVVVDGVEYNIGTAKTESGVTTVTVDQTALQKQLDVAKETVVVPVTLGKSANTVVAQFVVANVDEMAEKEMTLSVQVDDVSYNMRAIAIDTGAVMDKLGATDPTKAPVSVTITELSNTDVTLENGELVLPPISFTVTASYGGKTVEVEVFEKYVQRVIEVSEGVDASKITTAVVVENGKQRHVPTEVFQKDGKWYARINSLTNSTYALINYEASFTDDDGKWFEAVVTEMASRGVINGRSDGVFDGEANITRAEFAAILIRALGLPENGDASAFTDVASDAWYSGAVDKAYEYKLIEGRGNGLFDPQANITRQEAMAMVHRAAAITEFAGATGTLAAFSDAGSISDWALNDARWNVGSGLIQGDAGMICGKNSITRGEIATIILRLLQKSELVDVRTKA